MPSVSAKDVRAMTDDNNEYGNGSMTDRDWQDMWSAMKWTAGIFVLSCTGFAVIIGGLLWWMQRNGLLTVRSGPSC